MGGFVTPPTSIQVAAPPPFYIAFSTRIGGVSKGAFSSLNLGLLTEDEPSLVFKNREALLASLGTKASHASMCHQVHGSTVVQANSPGIDVNRVHPKSDGIWTESQEDPVVVLSADCVPIALCRLGENPAVAAVHAGWRGLLSGVVAAAVQALGSSDLHAFIGPAIGQCCYPVSKSIAELFQKRFGNRVVKFGHVDLVLASHCALQESGISKIEIINACTSCESDRFFSHRRDNGQTGRQGLVAFIKN